MTNIGSLQVVGTLPTAAFGASVQTGPGGLAPSATGDRGGHTRGSIERARTPALRVLVVDDQEVVRLGIVAVLERHPGFVVVAQTGTVAEAIKASDAYLPDIVVVEVRLPDGSGISAVRELKAVHPAIRVVMFTSCSDEDAVYEALLAGVSGYMIKQVKCGDLVTALEAVGRGGLVIDPAVTGPLLERIRAVVTDAPRHDLAGLTDIDREILLHVAEGETNKEIAARVFRPVRTVQQHVSSIIAKLGLQRRGQIAAYIAHRDASYM